MEGRVKAAFASWTAKTAAAPEPDQGPVMPRQAEARLIVDPGVTQTLQVVWMSPPNLVLDTAAKRRRDLIQDLGLAVLNRRYSVIGRGTSPPFQGAGAYKGPLDKSAEVATIGVSADPGRWREALATAEQEQRRIVQFGVRQEELDREIVEVRASLQATVASAATRRPADLADDLVDSLSDDTVVTSPADDQVSFEADVKGLSAQTVTAALKTVFEGQGPLVFMASPTPVEGDDAAILAALSASQKIPVAPPVPDTKISWPYERFGPTGKVIKRREIADLGVTQIQFSNGARLTVKPTTFSDDEVLVRVNVGQGLLGLPSDQQSPLWGASALIEGGLKKINVEDMERVLAAKVYGGRFSASDDTLVFSGGTRTQDLPTQLQVLTAFASEPAWRLEAFQRVKTAYKTAHDQYDSTTGGVLARDLSGLLHAGDRRWTFPSRADVSNAAVDDIKTAIALDLAAGPLEVVIVGDITVERAIAATAETFGALPRRIEPKPPTQSQRAVAFPTGTSAPVVLTHKGRADQAVGFIAWPTSDYWANPQRARDTAVLREIMNLRLTDELRENQGATYSPDVGSQHSLVWTGWGYIAANVEVPPDKIQKFFDDTQKIAADLTVGDVSADELSRAKKPRIEALSKAQKTNNYWLSELSGAQADPRRLDVIRQLIPGTQRVTAADVKRAAQMWFKREAAYKVIVQPATRPSAE